MAITLKSSREIGLMREAGALVADVLAELKTFAQPGVTTAELDRIAGEMTKQAGAIALFKGVRSPYAKIPFPGNICASVNEQIVHGIPSGDVVLKNGDIVGVDFGIKLKGYCGDAAATFGIGDISAENRKLMDVTKHVRQIAIDNMAPGVKWSRIAVRMQDYAESAGFSVVKEFTGHGIGSQMHEDPQVPNFVSSELLVNDIILKEGMVLAVEPMINLGGSATRTLKDGWTVVTRDGKYSAHFEHTIAIVKDGCRVLTEKK